MSNVKRLEIVPKFSQQTVSMLEELLAQAKAGDIIEVVATTKWGDGTYTHSWTGCDNLMELVGILERQKMATLRRMDTD